MEVGLKGDVGRHLWAQVAALISWAVGKVYVAASQGTGSSSCTLSKQSGTKHTGGYHSELSSNTWVCHDATIKTRWRCLRDVPPVLPAAQR
jgi:hypothetical protein